MNSRALLALVLGISLSCVPAHLAYAQEEEGLVDAAEYSEEQGYAEEAQAEEVQAEEVQAEEVQAEEAPPAEQPKAKKKKKEKKGGFFNSLGKTLKKANKLVETPGKSKTKTSPKQAKGAPAPKTSPKQAGNGAAPKAPNAPARPAAPAPAGGAGAVAGAAPAAAAGLAKPTGDYNPDCLPVPGDPIHPKFTAAVASGWVVAEGFELKSSSGGAVPDMGESPETRETLFVRDGRWVHCIDGWANAEWDVGPHGGINGNRGVRPGLGQDSLMQSHHGIQNAWAKERFGIIAGKDKKRLYDENAAPSILLLTGKSSGNSTPHRKINAEQMKRGDPAKLRARSYMDERKLAEAELSSPGIGAVDGPFVAEFLKAADEYFCKLLEDASPTNADERKALDGIYAGSPCAPRGASVSYENTILRVSIPKGAYNDKGEVAGDGTITFLSGAKPTIACELAMEVTVSGDNPPMSSGVRGRNCKGPLVYTNVFTVEDLTGEFEIRWEGTSVTQEAPKRHWISEAKLSAKSSRMRYDIGSCAMTMLESAPLLLKIDYRYGGFTADAGPAAMQLNGASWKKAKFHAEAEKATIDQEPKPFRVEPGDPPSQVSFGISGGFYKVMWPRKSDKDAVAKLGPCQFE